MNRRFILAISAASLLAALAVGTPAQSAEPAPVLSPKMDAALRQLTDESFSKRESAVKAIEQSLVDQVGELLKVNDPEAQEKIGTVLEFNDALQKWAIDSLKLPAEERASQLKWGLKPEIFPIIANIYSTNAKTRAAGVKDLAKIPGPEASSVLARLILDEEREVYLAAMEAVWDRPATPAIIDALWNRAVLAVLAYRDVGGVIPPSGLQFRGQPLGAVFAGNYFAMTRVQDNGLATDVLVQLKGPLLSRKATDFLEQYEKGQVATAADPRNLTYVQPLRNVYAIVEACKFQEALPILVKLASAKVGPSTSTTFNKKSIYWSNRTGALGAALVLLKQDPADYKVQKHPGGSNLWVTANQDDEDEAVQKLQDFWNKHKDEYVGAAATQSDTKPAATRPAP